MGGFKAAQKPGEEKPDMRFKQELEKKYEEYKKIMKEQQQEDGGDLFSREAKLNLMREVLMLFG